MKQPQQSKRNMEGIIQPADAVREQTRKSSNFSRMQMDNGTKYSITHYNQTTYKHLPNTLTEHLPTVFFSFTSVVLHVQILAILNWFKQSLSHRARRSVNMHDIFACRIWSHLLITCILALAALSCCIIL